MVNRGCLAHWLTMALSKYREIPQDNCGVSLLRYQDGRVRPVTINSIAHLDGL
jgi:hypothetical protein